MYQWFEFQPRIGQINGVADFSVVLAVQIAWPCSADTERIMIGLPLEPEALGV